MNFLKQLQILEKNMCKQQERIEQLENLVEHLGKKYFNPIEEECDVFDITPTKIEYVDGKEYISTISSIHFIETFLHKNNNSPINKFVIQMEECYGNFILYRQSDLPQPQIGTIVKHHIKDTTLYAVNFLQI